MIGSMPATSAPRVAWIDSPAGRFWFGMSSDGSPLAGWATLDEPPIRAMAPRPEWNLQARLTRHFSGRFDDFRDLPLPAGPEFFRACWRTLRESNPGERWTYRELASRADRPAAVRAAGAAMRRNPLPILIPCHRVVASDGSLGGYAGDWGPQGRGGAIKRFLLDLESANAGKTASIGGQPRADIHR